MLDHLLPHPIIRKLPIIYGFGAEKPDLVDPTVELHLILPQCLGPYIVQNLTLAHVVVGHECILKLVSKCRHPVGMVLKKNGRWPIRFTEVPRSVHRRVQNLRVPPCRSTVHPWQSRHH